MIPGSRLRVVSATTNRGKLAEIATIVGDRLDIVARPADVPDVVEDAPTLHGNARLKASALVAATGLPAIADDTGLEVAALDGRPGVHTGRFAGDDATDAGNRAHLLAELDGRADRAARFRTVALLRWPDGGEVVAVGTCDGTIATAERGDRGFGYDALFIPDDGDGRTFAEMSAGEKDALSHRGRALRDLLGRLDRLEARD